MITLEDRWRRIARIELAGPIDPDVQAVVMLGGPYPETRNSWLRFVSELDPLASRWLSWAFETYRITPRVHAWGLNCQHPDAKLFDVPGDETTCLVCRLLNELEVVPAMPSIEAMGDLYPELDWLRVEVAR